VSRGVWFNNRSSICRLNLKFESSAIHTYYDCIIFPVRNAIDDLGFLGQVTGIELSNLGQVTGIALRRGRSLECVYFTDFPSICRLNLKFESSAIHMYVLLFPWTVRNAIDDSGFLDQVIGIELSNLGHCFHLMGHLRWPKRERDRERGKETDKEKEQEVRGNRVDLGQKDRLTLIWSLVDRT